MRRLLRWAPLGVVAAAAAIGLWRWSASEPHADGRLGGPLFAFVPGQVEALEMRRVQGTSRLERDGAAGWVLSGAARDLVDPDRVESALAVLAAGAGHPVLAGTLPDERRFGFGGEQSLELVFHLRDSGRQRLALGDVNPVSELFYASGAGRTGVFGIDAELYLAAMRLPDSVRLPRLLPEMRDTDLDSLRLYRRGDETLVLARLAGDRWWLRLAAGSSAPGGRAAGYHGRYADRRLEHQGSAWLLADTRRVREMIFRATGTAVVEFPGPDRQDAAALAEAGLLPPYRELALYGRDGELWQVAFGELSQRERLRVPAIRQGALVVARGEALLPLEGPLSEFLDLGALSFLLAAADSFRVDEPQRPLLWGNMAADADLRRQDRRSIWVPVAPGGWEMAFGEETTANQLSDLQLTLDRLECVEALASSPQNPLAANERWRLRAWLPGSDPVEVWLGRSRQDGRPLLWRPADGQCLVVPQEILITLRNLRLILRRA